MIYRTNKKCIGRIGTNRLIAFSIFHFSLSLSLSLSRALSIHIIKTMSIGLYNQNVLVLCQDTVEK